MDQKIKKKKLVFMISSRLFGSSCDDLVAVDQLVPYGTIFEATSSSGPGILILLAAATSGSFVSARSPWITFALLGSRLVSCNVADLIALGEDVPCLQGDNLRNCEVFHDSSGTGPHSSFHAVGIIASRRAPLSHILQPHRSQWPLGASLSGSVDGADDESCPDIFFQVFELSKMSGYPSSGRTTHFLEY